MKSTYAQHKIFVLLISAVFCFTNDTCIAQAGFPFAYGDQVVYYPRLHSKTLVMTDVKEGLVRSLSQVAQIYDIRTATTINAKDIKRINISDDRIEVEVKGRNTLFTWHYSLIDDSTMLFIGKQNAGNYIFLPSAANFAFAQLDAAQQFADNIYALQYPAINRIRDSLLNEFKQKLQAFKEANKEAVVKEEQEKLFLQADTAGNKGDYFNAIRMYNKAIAMDELCYPKAYANVALLYAQINFFDYAIYNMQKYMWMETDEAALRGAKDKMYQWEALIYY